MAAIPRPPPTSSGQLVRTPLPHLLVYAHDRELTGTFDFRAPDGTSASVLVLVGNPAKAQLSAPPTYLGQVLLELGTIDSATHDESLRTMSNQRALHGQILLGAGKITEAQLEAALRAQIVRKLVHVARLPPSTVFEFYADFDGLTDFGGEPTPVDPFPATWSAIREQPSLEHAKAALDRVALGRIRLAKTAQIERLGLSVAERRWVDLLGIRPMKLEEFLGAAEIGERVAQLLVYCLAITKQIELVSETEEIPPPSSSSRHAIPTPVSSAPSSPKAVGRVTLNRQTRTRPAGAAEDTAVRSPTDSRVTPPPGAVHAQSPDLTVRRAEIIERARVIDKQNYFEMLGVAPAASLDDVKNAYLALAKTWHPDRLPPALADAKDACSRVFARLTEAQQTLTDPKKREGYLRLMKEGGETPEQQEEIANVVSAAMEFQKAEICLKKHDLVQAEDLARRAVQMDPEQADYIALLAWLESMKPDAQSPEATQTKIDRLEHALQVNARCERAYFYRAMLYKRQHREALAHKDFQKVAELNPKNIDAQRELRIYEMRGGPPRRITPNPSRPAGAPAKPGLFQKFFKK